MFALSLVFLSSAMAAIPVQQVATEKHNYYLKQGVFVGGHTQDDLTLVNLRHSVQGPSGERLVLDLNTSRPGFFHISIQRDPLRIVAELENVTDSKVTEGKLNDLLKNSKVFKHAKVFSDKINKETIIEILLKKQVGLEVFELVSQNQPGRIVLDTK